MSMKVEEILSKEKAYLTDKAIHTRYKIQYVREYVNNWVRVASENNAININFIDCMCNAGIYRDGDFCSAIEVLKIFRDCAYRYPNKVYNLFLNDYDANKIRIIKYICQTLYASYPKNLHIYFNIQDVNEYLYNVRNKYSHVFGYPSMTILYVDPYSFHTVRISAIEEFIRNTYCELLFNLFTSDFNRNKGDAGIRLVLGGDYNIKDVHELLEHIVRRLRIGKMKYFLSYPFRQQKNVELYQILFASPSEKGLDKLKDALWKIFNGSEFYKTNLAKEQGQLSLFTEADEQDMAARRYAEESISNIVATFSGSEVSYEVIERFVLERSLLKSSQIITYIIKPMLTEGKLIKRNLVKKNNYKKDNYTVNK